MLIEESCIEFCLGKLSLIQQDAATKQSGGIEILTLAYRLSQHRHGTGCIAQSFAGSGIEEIRLYILSIQLQSLVAHIRHGDIILHHIRHIRHTQQYCHVISLCLRDFLQLGVSLLQIAHRDVSLREIVAAFQIFGIQLQSVFQRLGCKVKLMHAESTNTIIFHHVEVFFLLLFHFLSSLLATK